MPSQGSDTGPSSHCLTGGGIGEILGLAIATALGWGDIFSIALAAVLAFFVA